VRPFAVVILLLLSACHFSWPRVSNVAVQQGNVITQEMVDRLKVGMTRRQVAFVMGEPVLRDPFNPNRWDYVYSLQVGAVTYQKIKMSLLFDNDVLTSFSGDVPQTSEVEAAAAKAQEDPLLPTPQDDALAPPGAVSSPTDVPPSTPPPG
jgi:outer membrane protein assembly factor BamE